MNNIYRDSGPSDAYIAEQWNEFHADAVSKPHLCAPHRRDELDRCRDCRARMCSWCDHLAAEDNCCPECEKRFEGEMVLEGLLAKLAAGIGVVAMDGTIGDRG